MQEAFIKMAKVLASLKALPRMFFMLLVGLTGDVPQMQSCAIRALIFNMKQIIQVDSLFK